MSDERLCICGHSAHWHAPNGVCEGEVDCDCRAFRDEPRPFLIMGDNGPVVVEVDGSTRTPTTLELRMALEITEKREIALREAAQAVVDSWNSDEYDLAVDRLRSVLDTK